MGVISIVIGIINQQTQLGGHHLVWFVGFISNYLLLVYKPTNITGGAPLGGELPTFIVFVGEPGPLVISMGFLWGQGVHSKNWGELTHLNDSWDEPPSSVTLGWYLNISSVDVWRIRRAIPMSFSFPLSDHFGGFGYLFGGVSMAGCAK